MTGTFLGHYNYERLIQKDYVMQRSSREIGYVLCALANYIGALHISLVCLHNICPDCAQVPVRAVSGFYPPI
jgi:hypothetical protein